MTFCTNKNQIELKQNGTKEAEYHFQSAWLTPRLWDPRNYVAALIQFVLLHIPVRLMMNCITFGSVSLMSSHYISSPFHFAMHLSVCYCVGAVLISFSVIFFLNVYTRLNNSDSFFKSKYNFNKFVSLHSVYDEMCADAVGKASRLFGVEVNLRDNQKFALCLLMAHSCEKSVSNNSIWFRKLSHEVLLPSTLLLIDFIEKRPSRAPTITYCFLSRLCLYRLQQ